eukprot:CAMPEP_0172303694 /NCGR_PEP_ID=MMETSP1058-20130122/5205_1 /TAXON_ID=83371 /ORGANISM="Detonula confervacea, Strain CCMP 353" /LENGTH=1050 /DNA_ID=CAMNT_0013014627 /DNA_START=83 /DNA_END=3235 /DNA_ORIENTATION=+
MKTCNDESATNSNSNSSGAANDDHNSNDNNDNNDNNTCCPSCGTPNAAFSKNQMKKLHRERKCKLCTEKMTTPGKNKDVAEQPMGKNMRKKMERAAKKKERGKASANEKGEIGASSASKVKINGGDDGHGKTRSKYFQNKGPEQDDKSQQSSSSSDNDKNDALSCINRMMQDKNGDSDDAENNWSPLQSEDEENSAHGGLEDTPVGKRCKSNQDVEDDGLDDTPAGGKIQKRSVRDKMEMARNAALGKSKKQSGNAGDSGEDYGSGSSGEDDIYSNQKGRRRGRNNRKEVSLEALKHKILGRSISSMYDIDHDAEAALSSHHSHPSSKGMIMDAASAFTDGSTVARHLQQELSCPICHDRLYNPVSLLCGHSFCRVCLNWWLDQQEANRANNVVDSENDNDTGANNDGDNCGTCPSCREPIPNTNSSTTNDNDDDDDSENNNNKPNIQINTALKSVLDALYGSEMNQRRLAEERQRLKAQGGENGGLHARGCEEIVPLHHHGNNEDEHDELDFMRRDENGNDNAGRYDDEEHGWMALYAKANRPGWSQQRGGGQHYNHGNNNAGTSIMIRRNVVLDDCDQRYQLSLGLTKCTYSHNSKNMKSNNNNNKAAATSVGIHYDHRGILDIELCLLTMEEDEVDDSGFPTFVNDGDDDEALICTSNDRIHSCIESSVRVVPLSELEKGKGKSNAVFGRAMNEGGDGEPSSVREVSLSRGMIGRDGAVRFRIDLNKALEEDAKMSQESGNDDDGKERDASLQVVKLRFRHVDTGAILELRLPSKVSDTDEKISDEVIEFCSVSKPAEAKNDASRYLLDGHDDDEEDHDEPNEYEEDGFLVHGSQGSDEEEFDSHGEGHDDDDDDDDDGECQICNNGGDLIVCDGGDQQGGCGLAYHVHCIGRSMIPPGDWICNLCAKGIGMDVGIEGHEYEVEEEVEEPLAIDDTDDEGDEVEEIEATSTKNKPLAIDDSDDEEEMKATSTKNKPLAIDDSDDEEEEVEEIQATSTKNKPLVIDDSDDDDEIVPVQKKKRIKRKILGDSGSESEDGGGSHKRFKSE